MDLVVGTHGRGIYKMNLRPIQEAYKEGVPREPRLFEVPLARLPWINDTHHDPNLCSLERVPITFFLTEPGEVSLAVKDGRNRTVWKKVVSGRRGFNQIRWDLVTRRADRPVEWNVAVMRSGSSRPIRSPPRPRT